MSNIKEVAKHAQVSVMTVSRVLNNSASVKEETRQRVFQSMQQLNYVPNQLANALYRGESRTLSVILPDIRNPHFTAVMRGAEDAACAKGYRVILCNTDEDLRKEYDYIQMSYSMRVEGICILPTGDESRGNLQKLKSFGVPFVLIDRPVEGIHADLIKATNEEGALNLVRHLYQKGHHRIAIMVGKHSISTWRELLDGYRRGLLQVGITPTDDWVYHFPSFPHEGALETVVDSILQSTQKPTAIIAGSHFEASQVMHILHRKNVAVPDDMSVACFGDSDPFPHIDKFMTAAEFPVRQLGSLAVDVLLSRISNQMTQPSVTLTVPYSIAPGASTLLKTQNDTTGKIIQ